MQCDENTITCLHFGQCNVPLVQNECCIDNKYLLWISGQIGVVGQFSDCRSLLICREFG